MTPLLTLRGASVSFLGHRRLLGPGKSTRILSDISLEIPTGSVVGLVGESGSGKSTLARAISGLHPLSDGVLEWRGHVSRAPKGSIGFVFQDPFSSLNPRRQLWWLVTEPNALLTRMSTVERRQMAETLLLRTGLSKEFLFRFPHQLSGGQRQRVAIARALSTNPDMLVLDEPTSALDLTVQAQILNVLLRLQKKIQVTMLLISHDLSVVRHLSDHVGVMHAGRIVEFGSANKIFSAPDHPYTAQLIEASFLRPAVV